MNLAQIENYRCHFTDAALLQQSTNWTRIHCSSLQPGVIFFRKRSDKRTPQKAMRSRINVPNERGKTPPD
ncbi:hypothetical protein TNCT_595721 [Trichonephila clavata]|uniref:Uncharacterized protein n=1 Tax=Trichonephila clavata TaxID=2740835 RepID=A0A8X6K5N8_TRICU|nr:hypothetical protein TNCT_595721 [Trichonephila clavata]